MFQTKSGEFVSLFQTMSQKNVHIFCCHVFVYLGIHPSLIENTVEPLHNGHCGNRRKWPL